MQQNSGRLWPMVNSCLMVLIFLFISLALLSGCVQEKPAIEKPILTIYTYDSMVSEYGLGPKVVPKFEEKCNCTVKMVSKGDAGQVLNALIIEKSSPKADVVIGIDNSMASKAIESGVLDIYEPKAKAIVPEEYFFDKTYHIIPFDYGFMAFIYDAHTISGLDSFESLLRSDLKKKILIQNPRTSSPGLA